MQKLANKLKRLFAPPSKKERRWADIGENDREMIQAARPYTMTSRERLYALVQSVQYISRYQIEGDIVECGVWKGGSMLVAAKKLVECNDLSRQLWLYDTFEGMPEPGKDDVSRKGEKAAEVFSKTRNSAGGSEWCRSPLDEVKGVLGSSGYPVEKFQYIKGKVEETIPGEMPERISILRLDTDWYASTRHELIHLFPRLVRGGILLLDDYGYWQGSRKAVDEYFAEHPLPILLTRIDSSGRIAVKPF